MNKKQLQSAIKQGNVEWSLHVLRMLAERGISRKAVKHIIMTGEIIEEYQDDKPFPSALIFGMWDNNPLHAVIAFDVKNKEIHVITTYEPDLHHFESDFKTRRKP